MNKFNKTKSKDQKRIEHQTQIIQRKNDEIESLKRKISKLEISNSEKDDLINSVDSLRKELSDVVEDLKEKGKEYDALISDLMLMRKIFDKDVFNGNWWLVKRFMK